MTTPKKPLSKTESAIQLGNVLKYAAGGRGGKLRKIGEKATKSASPIKEVKKAKKSLKNQKVDSSAKVPIKKLQQTQAIKNVVNKVNARTPIKVPKAQTQSSGTSKKMTKLFDEMVNYKHKPYSKLSKKAKRDLKNRGITPEQYEID